MQMEMSMMNSSGCGLGLPSGPLARTIQMHCGGQTLAQMPQAVQRSSPVAAS